MVPKSRDIILSTKEEKALWQTCFTAAPARLQEFEPSFPKVERKDQHPGPAIWAELHHCHQVALSHDNHRCTHGAEPTKSRVLSPAQEAVIMEFRRRTLRPLDDVMGCLRESIPKLSRSSLRRCLLRHGHLTATSQRDQNHEQGKVCTD